MEHSADEGATDGGWGFFPNHSSGTWLIGMNGNVGNDVCTFARPSAAAWHQFTILLDRTASTHEIVDVYVDGSVVTLNYSADFNNTSSFINSTLNFMSRNNTTFFGAGRMAEVAIWPGILLTAGEAVALGRRFAPPLIRPTTKPFYWPMIGRDATVLERGYGADATINGAVQTDHPAIIYPSRAYISPDAAAPPVVVPAAFASGWAHSWVNPAGVPRPASVIGKRHLTSAPSPAFHLLGVQTPLQWLGSSATIPVKSPGWPSRHLIEQSVGAPLHVPSHTWFPVGGQLAQRSPVYPSPQATGLALITPTDFAIFPHVPPWSIPISKMHYDFTVAGKLVEIAPGPPPPFIPPPVAVVNCGLTLGDLKTRVYEQLDDDGTYYTGNEVRHALNAAGNLFALLTLCNEKTVAIDLTGGQCFHLPSAQTLIHFLLPLRITTLAGNRIRPATIHELDGLSSTWRNTAGTPTHYVTMGYDLLGFTPQYASTTAVNMTYAAMPIPMEADTQTPDGIPADQQVWLVDYACWWLRLKEGSQELVNAGEWLKRFVIAATKYGEFVRRRSYGQKYDTLPMDLTGFDMGRLDIALPGQKRNRRVS